MDDLAIISLKVFVGTEMGIVVKMGAVYVELFANLILCSSLRADYTLLSSFFRKSHPIYSSSVAYINACLCKKSLCTFHCSSYILPCLLNMAHSGLTCKLKRTIFIFYYHKCT